jgi:hypothetical protein
VNEASRTHEGVAVNTGAYDPGVHLQQVRYLNCVSRSAYGLRISSDHDAPFGLTVLISKHNSNTVMAKWK